MRQEAAMNLAKYRHPVLFYLVAILVPWTLWFSWGALSHSALYDTPGWVIFGSILGFAGLTAPMACALALILPDKEMRDELISACLHFKGIHGGWYVLTFALPLGSILLAQAVSLLFGYSAGQFRPAGNFSFSAGNVPDPPGHENHPYRPPGAFLHGGCNPGTEILL
jgi:hypothetical protein